MCVEDLVRKGTTTCKNLAVQDNLQEKNKILARLSCMQDLARQLVPDKTIAYNFYTRLVFIHVTETHWNCCDLLYNYLSNSPRHNNIFILLLSFGTSWQCMHSRTPRAALNSLNEGIFHATANRTMEATAIP